jgi:hypothetical protein
MVQLCMRQLVQLVHEGKSRQIEQVAGRGAHLLDVRTAASASRPSHKHWYAMRVRRGAPAPFATLAASHTTPSS